MPNRSTLERPKRHFASRSVSYDAVPEWARRDLDVSPDTEVTAFYMVRSTPEQRMESRKQFMAVMDKCGASAAKNGMTEADLDDILNSPE